MSSLTPVQTTALAEFLHNVPLFAHLHEEELAVLVGMAKRATFRAGQDLFHQNDDDRTLYIVYSGHVRLIHINPEGAPVDVGIAEAGRMLGESSLLLNEPHDVTAIPLEEVTAIVFTGDTFMPLHDQYPRLWGRLSPSDPVARRLSAPQFGWQAADEVVIAFVHQHWWGLMRRMFFPMVALLGIVAVLQVVQQALPTFFALAVTIGVAVLLGILTYVYIDWRNDFWVVTSKRVVHVDEIVLIRKKRDETPLVAITQVNYARHGFAAAIFDFGDLDVETFTGTIGMRDLPHPMILRRLMQDEIEKLRSREQAAQRKTIRGDLERRILSKDEVAEPVQTMPEKATTEEAPLRPAVALGIVRYFFPKLVDRVGNTIIWRKHWIILWRHEWISTLLIALLALAFFNWYGRTPPLGTLLDNSAWWIFPIIFGGLAAWWWWVFEDWRNDEYILTTNRVIEIQRTPFALDMKRRESPLSDFQSTELKVVGPWQRIFRYGTLIIKLPGAQVEFKNIVNPAAAQSEINKRLNEFNRKQSESEALSRRNELSDWFAAYDEIRLRENIARQARQGGQRSNGST